MGYRPTGEVRPYRYDHVESTVARWELASFGYHGPDTGVRCAGLRGGLPALDRRT
jgi:hypothetical protein